MSAICHKEAAFAGVHPCCPPVFELSRECYGDLVWLASGWRRIGQFNLHCDTYVCRECRSRIVFAGRHLLYEDTGNHLEAEGPLLWI